MYSPRRLQHYTIDHGRLIGDQPVQPYLLDCISKLVEIHGLLDVAVCAQAITIHEIPLFFRGSHDDHGDSLGPRIALICLRTSIPSTLGNFKSSSTSLGG